MGSIEFGIGKPTADSDLLQQFKRQNLSETDSGIDIDRLLCDKLGGGGDAQPMFDDKTEILIEEMAKEGVQLVKDVEEEEESDDESEENSSEIPKLTRSARRVRFENEPAVHYWPSEVDKSDDEESEEESDDSSSTITDPPPENDDFWGRIMQERGHQPSPPIQQIDQGSPDHDFWDEIKPGSEQQQTPAEPLDDNEESSDNSTAFGMNPTDDCEAQIMDRVQQNLREAKEYFHQQLVKEAEETEEESESDAATEASADELETDDDESSDNFW